MPKRRTNDRRSGNRRSRAKVQRYVEEFTVSIASGATSPLTSNVLRGLPQYHNWRPVLVTFETNPAFVPGSATTPGYAVPAAVQLQLVSPTNKKVATSNAVPLFKSSRTIKVQYPASADWFAYDTKASEVFGYIEHICLGAASNNVNAKAYLRGVVQIVVHLQREYLLPECPSYTFEGENTGSCSTIVPRSE